jgi:hypothetical protein
MDVMVGHRQLFLLDVIPDVEKPPIKAWLKQIL